MAAVGGGLSASAVLAGVNTSTTVRCRFPARPCTSRSQARSERRLRVGRLWTGDGKTASKGPRPVNIGLTLQEDPSLLRLLRIAEKHKRKREAGFDSSGSEEEDNFVGFGVDGGRSLRSSRSGSQSTPLKSVLSPAEKPPPAPDLIEAKDAAPPPAPAVSEIKPLYGKVVKRGERIRKDQPSTVVPGARNTPKSKLVVKLAVKKTTKEVLPPKTVKAEQASKGKGSGADGRQPAKALAKNQKVRKSVVDLTNDEVQELNTDGSSKGRKQLTLHSPTSSATSDTIPIIRVLKDSKVELAGSASPAPVESEGPSQKKQSKVVWTLTLVKGQGKTSAVRRSPTEVRKSTGPMLGKFVKRSRPAAQEEGSDSLGSPTRGNSVPSASTSPGSQRRNPSHLLWIPQKRRTKDMGSSSAVAATTVAVSPKPVGKQRRVSKGTEGSPEEGAEAGWESGHGPSDQPATSSGNSVSRRPPFKFKRRKSKLNMRRKPGVQKTDPSTDSPVKRRKRKVAGNIYEPLVTLNSENQGEQQVEVSCAPGNTELASAEGTPSVTPVVSGRSSRVIKTPKRFLDDERMSHLVTRSPLKKNGIGSTLDPDVPKPAGHRRRSHHYADTKGDGHAAGRFQEDQSTSDAPQSSKGDQALSPGAGKLKFYERLKKLTATLAQKRVRKAGGTPVDQQGEAGGDEESQGPVKKRRRRRSKLTMEDIQSPGVVRKLAVHLNAAGATLPGVEHLDTTTGVNVEGPTQMESVGLTPRDLGERVLVEQEGTTHRISVSSSNKRMFHLLKRAKVQLIKIDQQKQLKSSQLLSGSVKLGESSETGVKRRRRRRMARAPNRDLAARQQQLLAGPRIKHVCRAAAVALGQPRAMVPDDIPRLSALPLHEREGIAPSPTAEAGAGEASDPESASDSEWTTSSSCRPEFRTGGVRSRRCMSCPGCLTQDDCGRCVHCLDKPKFGGPNTKRQCCIHRICSRIALKKARRMGIRNPKVQVRRGGRSSASGNASSEDEEGAAPRTAPSDLQSPSPSRKQPRRHVTPLCYSDLLRSESESDESTTHQPIPRRTTLSNGAMASLADEDGGNFPKPRRLPFVRAGRRRFDKQLPPSQAQDLPPSHSSASGGGGCGGSSRSPSLKLRLCLQLRLERLPPSVVRAAAAGGPLPPHSSSSSHQQQEQDGTFRTGAGSAADNAAPHQAHAPCVPPPSQSTAQHTNTNTPPNSLAALANRFGQREMASRQANTAHRVRIDFKEDCSVQNVWLMGGLSVLTSIPISPDSVCLLCASKGKHEMVYCQVCCEPFHSFCLKEEERPQEGNKENWCCRRCKYCHVCGRKSKHSKPVLQCRRCLYCYHPTCLGPTYPKPLKCNLPWVCMKCIRCRSCGMTPGKTWDMAWNHEQDLCPDCSVLHKLGNVCPVCQCCYEEAGCRKRMMKCARCTRWVHSKCEKISDEECERMKRRPVGGFICTPCGLGSWREELQEELRSGLQTVLSTLLDSPHTEDVLTCEQCKASPEDACVKSPAAVCDLRAVSRKLEQGGYSTVRAFSEDVATVMRRKLKGEDEHLPNELKSLYMQLMKEAFSWLNGGHMKTWEPLSQEFPSGMLPDAVLPPSDEHSYAQWLERDNFPAQGTKGLLSPGQIKRLFQDSRQCSLCQQHGDAMPNEAGRLLYLGQNDWAHVNCCIWSAEVQEDKGALLHVHSAVARGRLMRCDRCGLSGATVGCCLSSCQSNFHFMCARIRNCVFQEDQNVYCHKHCDLINGKEVTGSGFEVLRRIYVDFEGFSLRRKFLTGLEPDIINMMIGSLQIHHLGVLSELSANSGKLFPVGYQCSRWYWSTVNPYVRCKYTCQVREAQPSPPKQVFRDGHCQGSNQTIAHSPTPVQAMETKAAATSQPVEIPIGTQSPKAKLDAGSKSGYSHLRRPVGGLCRPLPSPGNASSKSHHILTISDLDETRRPRRLSTTVRGRNASPPRAESSPLLPRSLPFSSPNRSSPSSPTSPLATSGHLPLHAAVGNLPATLRHSPRVPQPFRVSQPESAEVPQDFLASSEPEDAAEMPIYGLDTEQHTGEQAILLVADELSADPNNGDEDTVILVTDQGVPYGHFDVDADEAVASVLNAKLEFNEALLHEDMVLQYRAHTGEYEEDEMREGEEEEEGGGRDEMEVAQTEEYSVDACTSTGSKEPSPPNSAVEVLGNDSSDDDGGDNNVDHYLNFSRTVVLYDASKDAAQAGLSCLPTSGTISQLDGADNESESDAGEVTGEDDSQEMGMPSSQESEPSSGTSSSEGHASTVTTLKICSKTSAAAASVASSKPVILVGTQNSVLLDHKTGKFVSADVGSTIDLTKDSQDGDSSTDSVSMDEVMPQPDVRQLSVKTRPFSNPRVRLIETSSAPTHITVNPPVASSRQPRKKVGKIPAPVGRPRKIIPSTSSPAFRAVPLKDPVTAAPIVINGFGSPSQLNETPKGKPIAIRLTTPKPIQPQGGVATGTSKPPQILLVNRFGQILVKDPQSNTFQSPNAASSPSLSNISQIAKIIHSRNVLPRPVPKILVAPVSSQCTVVPQSVGVTTHIISYTSSSGSATPTNVWVRKLNMPEGAVLAQQVTQSQSGKPSNVRIKNVTIPPRGQSQGEMAQAIIDKAMASHRDVLRSPNLSPSQFTVHPFLNKLESPQPIATLPSELKRTRPAILARSAPQVRVKRVSSVSERVGVKKCRADFLPPAPPTDKEDPNGSTAASRASGVRMKTPSSKDILALDQLKPDCPEQPKPDVPKPVVSKRETAKDDRPTVPKEANGGVPAKTHVWVSARDGDLSDWGPYSGLSSDEESSPPKRSPTESPMKDQPRLSFVITSDDGFKVEADSIEVAWRAVLEGVQEARIGCGMRQLPVSVLSGAQLLGVVHNAVLYLLEQLQGASKCGGYRFRFHPQEKPEEELPINPSGCARAEIYQRKSTFDMFDFLASQHRKLPEYTALDEEEDDLPLKSTRRATNSELPVAMRFRHLKRTSKEAVGVYRSPIHGRGLFCKRNIEAGEMVIEYAGNVIRSVLTDKREKHYDRKGIGCYMFRIDDFDVVDATMHGNAARFINHSCDPNCYSRVISVDGLKHIVIFALRKVLRGEELTYDYKFPKEDANSKLHCNCGARRCRRFLN
ncbi:histone-lysine N-methyltransferase 2A isoform X3 [Alosa sapidissima]|uniref:histone-lysine N-methyltransferase 2A isoform X3 n=1 Tax=Alosa sapidissima TaxID=34773 RepID=UPI001C097EF7|nr:histone-lysine N-methyltransferase 2A isoform X3 [Alosa sapidissima]